MIRDKQKPGAYTIWNIKSDTRYIGSAARSIDQRWKEHRYRLRLGTHDNRHLQNAWNKYGEDAFQFIVLENTTPEESIATEQKWMDYFRSIKAKLYNVSPRAGSQLGFKHSEETCQRIREIHRTRFQDPAVRARQIGYLSKGWHDPVMKAKVRASIARFWSDPIRRKESGIVFSFSFVSPDGTPYPDNVSSSDFCRLHNLDISSMAKVLKGEHPHYHGWRRLEPGQEPTPFEGKLIERGVMHYLTAPDGTQHTPTNLEAFCREHSLHPSGMRALVLGEIQQHHGWTGYREGYTPKTDNKRDALRYERRFIDPKGNLQITDNLYQFCKHHNLDKGAMLRLEAGKVKSHKGWTRYANITE